MYGEELLKPKLGCCRRVEVYFGKLLWQCRDRILHFLTPP